MPHRVLIVDDSLVTTKRLSDILESLGGYEIVGTANNGSEGLKLFDTLSPDLVLMDMVMPVMSGIDCLRAIKKINPNVHVVFISSMGAVERKIEEALDNGASAVVNKPFDPDELRETLAGLFSEE